MKLGGKLSSIFISVICFFKSQYLALTVMLFQIAEALRLLYAKTSPSLQDSFTYLSIDFKPNGPSKSVKSQNSEAFIEENRKITARNKALIKKR